MAFKLICSDIDGTLLNKERELSERTISIAQKISKDVPFVLISSRMPQAMSHLQLELQKEKHPMVAYNGGMIISYDEQNSPRIIDSIEIENKVTSSIIEFNKTINPVHLSLYHNTEWYVPSMDYWAKREWNNTKVKPEVASLSAILSKWNTEKKGAHKIMCMGEAEDIQKMTDWLQENHGDTLHIYRSKDTYLELASKTISKASALEKLLSEQYDINMEEVIAFGDNYNDVEMLDAVGHGVAVDNAREEAKSVANEITDSNINDGVAKMLEKYFG